MRPPLNLSPDERKARRRAQMDRAALHLKARNLARGLTSMGTERQKYCGPECSPEVQRLVAFYRRRFAAASRLPELSRFELAWRDLRASMGEIIVPEPMIALRHD